MKLDAPFFNDPPAWFHTACAVVLGVGALPLVGVVYLCVSTGEFWPLWLLVPTISFAEYAAYKHWDRAREKRRETDVVPGLLKR
jgi:hypothetical protein